MDKHELVFGPTLEVDENLFQIAPFHTLRQFTQRMNRRLIRLEIIILSMFAIDIGVRFV